MADRKAQAEALVEKAAGMLNAGLKRDARQLLARALTYDSQNIQAWLLLARTADNRQEELDCINRVLLLDPAHAWARRRLVELGGTPGPRPDAAKISSGDDGPGRPATPTPSGTGPLRARSLPPAQGTAGKRLKSTVSETRKKRSRTTLLSPMLLLALAALALACGGLALVMLTPAMRAFVFGSQIPTLMPTGLLAQTTGEPAPSCQQLIDRALQASNDSCSQIGSNKVCYGNNTLQAKLAPDAGGRFEQAGDVIDAAALQELSASPLDLESAEWGIAIFKLVANLPRTLPGENVTFLVFGNTVLSRGAGNLEAFYFSSGVGQVACEQVPFDGILIQMPDGAGVTFTVNGAQVTLLGQAAIRARANDLLTVSVVSGSALVSSNGVERYFGAGHQVSVPLGGVGGVEAAGPPSDLTPLPPDVMQVSCTLAGSACSPSDIDSVSPSEAQAAVSQAMGNATPGTQVAALAPTPTATGPQPNAPTATPSPSLAPGASTPTRTPTPTPASATGTSLAATASPTRTVGPTPTGSATTTPTSLPGNPTATPTPTPTPTPTLVLGDTATPTPTPTPTEQSEGCGVEGGDLVFDNLNLNWTLQNTSTDTVRLDQLDITWEASPESQKLREIFMDGVMVWSGNDNTTPSLIPQEGVWIGSDDDRRIQPGVTSQVRFVFHDELVSGIYILTATFDSNCTASSSNES